MTVDKMIFYGVVIAILSGTVLISQCTYSMHSCRQQALKEGKLSSTEIRNLCQAG